MPLYSYRCPVCSTEADEMRRLADSDSPGPECCQGPMAKVITAAMVSVPVSFGYQCSMSGETVTSYRKRRYLMEKHGVIDAREVRDTVVKKVAKRAEAKAEAKAYYDSLPAAVKQAAASPTPA